MTNPTANARHHEIAVYCDCCPHHPKKMAVLHPDAIQIISRRSGRKHYVRIPIPRHKMSHNVTK